MKTDAKKHFFSSGGNKSIYLNQEFPLKQKILIYTLKLATNAKLPQTRPTSN